MKLLYTCAEAAREIGVHPRSFTRLAESAGVVSTRMGSGLFIRYSRTDIELIKQARVRLLATGRLNHDGKVKLPRNPKLQGE